MKLWADRWAVGFAGVNHKAVLTLLKMAQKKRLLTFFFMKTNRVRYENSV